MIARGHRRIRGFKSRIPAYWFILDDGRGFDCVQAKDERAAKRFFMDSERYESYVARRGIPELRAVPFSEVLAWSVRTK